MAGRNEPIHGGAVKLLRLEDQFPNRPSDYSVLYLVSSALPPAGPLLARVARARGARFVWNQNGVAYPGWQAVWRSVNARLASMLGQADYVFYQSRFCKEAADHFLGPPSCPWEVLYNCVDTDLFRPSDAREARGAIKLLLGGNQDRRYRFEVAAQVCQMLRRRGADARLLVTGRLAWSAEAPQEARQIVSELQLADSVEFLGPYLQSEAPALLRRAHILLHTKYADPSPGLVVEALACGLPVVYSCSGGTPEIVGAAGRGVPVEHTWERDVAPDPEAMTQAVSEVIDGYPALSLAARRRAVEQFDIGPWLQRHAAVFSARLR